MQTERGTDRSTTRGSETGDDAANGQAQTQSALAGTRRDFVKAAAGAGVVGIGLSSAGVGPALGGVPTPRLHTEGRWIRDPNGNNVKLRGMAPADPGFYYQHHPKSFEEVLEWATDTTRGWHPNTVRLPCTQDAVSSLGIETYVTEVLRPAVDLLATRNVYAMVDFHLIRPYTQAATEEANQSDGQTSYDPIDDVMRNFWNRVAPEFADDEHVIYELFNEPTEPAMWDDDEGAWQTWRDAAQPWVDLVQDHAPETPLIIGSPRWTSVTHMAPEYPFDGENLIYAAHIYPDNGAPSDFDGTYGQPANDVPVVVTEFGWDPLNEENEQEELDTGTTSGWGQPFREWAEGYQNMGWISWCFDDSWAPTFFDSPNQGGNDDWTLKDGPEEMGGYVKTWLQETKDQDVPGQSIDDSTAPPAPANLTVTRTTEIGVDLAWDSVTDRGDSETAGLSHYNVFLDGELRDTVVAGTTQAAVQGLEPRSTYEVGVTAVDDANNESPTTSVVVETIATDAAQTPYTDHTVPGTIQAEDFDEGGNGVAYLDTSEQNEAGASYRNESVDVGTSAGDGYNVGYISAGEWLEYTVDIESAGTYVARVAASSDAQQGGSLRIEVDRSTVVTHNVWRTGGWSDYQEQWIGEVTLPAGEHIVRVVAQESGWNFDYLSLEAQNGGGGDDTTAPTTPSNLGVTGTSPSSVDVAWDASTDSGGAGLDQYHVFVDGTLDQEVPAGTTSATVADLAAETAYDVAVSAVDGAGNQSERATITASTDAGGSDGDTTPPTTPTNLAVMNTSSNTVDVDWDGAADNDTGVDSYVVYVDGSENQTVPAGTTSATVSGLSAGATYDVAVSAVDGAGNESGTATVTATTDDGGTGSGSGSGSGTGSGSGSGSGTGTDTDSGSGWWGSGTGNGSDSGSDTGGGWWGSGSDTGGEADSGSDGGSGWW